MGVLSKDLRDLGYSRTEKESPFDDDGELWSKGYELVCDETGFVIDNDSIGSSGSSFRGERDSSERTVYRYRNSEKIKLAGGHVSSYDWGTDEERNFFY